MTPSERISQLVGLLESDNGLAFAKKTGIPPASLSRIRNGKARAESYFPRIIMAYPDVNPRWLLEDEGLPLKSMAKKDAALVRLERLEKEVRRLADLLDSAKNSAKKSNGIVKDN